MSVTAQCCNTKYIKQIVNDLCSSNPMKSVLFVAKLIKIMKHNLLKFNNMFYIYYYFIMYYRPYEIGFISSLLLFYF